jgi:uncharacterized damage-inducible protein DinB
LQETIKIPYASSWAWKIKLLSYTELFDYFKSERTKLIEAFQKLLPEEYVKNRELSFFSIKDTFLHTISVENNWLHYSYRGLPNPSFKPEVYTDLESTMRYMSEVDQKTKALFKELRPEDLRKMITRKQSDGKEVSYALEKVLYHIPIEVIHHYGEIFAEFWKMNLDAPYLSYVRYSASKNV